MIFKEWLTNTWTFMILSCWRKVISFSSVILLLIITSCSSCSANKAITPKNDLASDYTPIEPLKQFLCDSLPIKPNATFDLAKDWDLEGKVYKIPEGVTIKSKGAALLNGTLIGDNTRIQSKTALFDNITIEGTWIVPEITTDLFRELSEVNAIRNVFALSNNDISNKIIIQQGHYLVSASSFGAGVSIKSNTILELGGTLALVPNDHDGCYVVDIRNACNVRISGSGGVVGDKGTHRGIKGEWGHGINISGGENIEVSGISIKDCWGDCIYVGNKSHHIRISNCKLDNGRRQGISVTSGRLIEIDNCYISNVNGTDPQYGIDIEPNEEEVVDSVLIKGTKINNCYGGIVCSGQALESYLGQVTIENCSIENTLAKYPVFYYIGEDVCVKNTFISSGCRTSIRVDRIKQFNVEGNKCVSTNSKPIQILNKGNKYHNIFKHK